MLVYFYICIYIKKIKKKCNLLFCHSNLFIFFFLQRNVKINFTFYRTILSFFFSSPFNLIFFCNRTQGKADTINLDQLITFLNEKQRDPTLNEILYPLYDEKRASEIINDYEKNETAKNQSESDKESQFIFSFLSLPLF